MPKTSRLIVVRALMLVLALVLAACNLGGAPEPSATPTPTATTTATVTSTLASPTPLPLTQLPTSTPIIPPTSVVQLPPTFVPISTPQPVRITILSPVPGSVVAGNVLIYGTAIHPQFLQYQLEYGPDPNNANLWYPINVSQVPVTGGVIGTWSTLGTQDGVYQLRLRVILRDGSQLSTVVGNIRVQNRVPTPVPSPTPATPRPIAAFSQSTYQAQAPINVRFFNQSAGNISSFIWNFGDGTTSNEFNPNHTYSQPGLYTVTLSVTGQGGTSNVSSQVNVLSTNPPVAAFNASPTSGTAPLVVSFDNQSTGQVLDVQWNFGDGAVSSQSNPTHTYANVGTYTVILRVTGPGGSSIATRQITVSNPSIPAPNAAFSANPTSGQAPLTVQFTNQTVGNVNTYVWNFGDGTLSTSQSPSHQFLLPGTYVVTLLASGPGGLDTAQQAIQVFPPPTFTPTTTLTPSHTPTGTLPPTATATATPTNTPTSTLTATPTNTQAVVVVPTSTSTATSTPLPPPTNTPTATATGTLPPTFTPTATSTNTPTDLPTATPTATSTDLPTFTPTATLTDVPTATPTETATDMPTVTPTETQMPPVASIDAALLDPSQPLLVQFSGAASQNATSYSWDFGDGNTSSEQNPLYEYSAGGNYTVSLTVQNSDGVTDTADRSITLTEPTATATLTAIPAPTAAFTAFVADSNQPLTVTFDSTGSTNVVSYLWDFGDGNSSTDANPTHTYAVGNTYNVTLTVMGSDGQTANTSQPVTVLDPTPVPTATDLPLPTAVINANVPDPNQPLTVQFSSAGSENAASYLWQFGDGNTSTDANPLYAYPFGGTFTVTLTVMSAEGLSAMNSQDVTVAEPPTQTPVPQPPTASFSQFVPDPNQPRTIQFMGDSSANAVSYFWDFGDGNTSTEANPLYTYGAASTYNVTLTVTSSDGLTDDETQSVLVVDLPTETPLPLPPVAVASASVPDPNQPLTVQFSSAGSENAVSYLWDFGDGNSSTESDPLHTYGADNSYTATLTVTSSDGLTASNTVDMTVAGLPPAPPVGVPQVTPVATFIGHSDDVNAVAWNPDNLRIVTGSSDGSIRLWDTNGSTLETLTPGHTDDVNALAWDATGSQLASASSDDTAIIWSVINGQPAMLALTLSGHTDDVNAVAWSPDNSRVATASSDGSVLIWDLVSGTPSSPYAVGGGVELNAVAWSPDGSIIVAGGSDGNIYVWDVASATPLTTISGHTDEVNSVGFRPGTLQLLSGSDDDTIRIWDVSTATQLVNISSEAGNVNAVAWNGTQRFATAQENGNAIVWDVDSQSAIAELIGHSDDVTSLSWNATGNALATGGDDDVTLIFPQ
jgi:PKD repeat protein